MSNSSNHEGSNCDENHQNLSHAFAALSSLAEAHSATTTGQADEEMIDLQAPKDDGSETELDDDDEDEEIFETAPCE